MPICNQCRVCADNAIHADSEEECAWCKQINMVDAMAHVIVEAGVVPGQSAGCRCKQCKQVAISMAEAGYLDRIKDKWWESDTATQP